MNRGPRPHQLEEGNAPEITRHFRGIFDILLDPINVANIPIEIRLILRFLEAEFLPQDATEDQRILLPAVLFMNWIVEEGLKFKEVSKEIFGRFVLKALKGRNTPVRFPNPISTFYFFVQAYRCSSLNHPLCHNP